MKSQPWRLTMFISGIAVIAVGTAMAAANPRRDAYQSYAAEKMSTYLKQEVCPDAPKNFGGVLREQCNQFVDRGKQPMKQWIAESTERYNYILFSIYKTELSLMTGLPSYQFKTLGIFQNFWIYEKKKQ
ncbi:MAG: hypothetical protein BRC33_08765 [Cyanobacteria bacterium SW_9_44_58]|nr:MAG: hypothetical protein BRC33_08765 [Cyanobacteria bacterium SW_9_44_58]